MCTSTTSIPNGTRGEVATVATKGLSSTRAQDVDESSEPAKGNSQEVVERRGRRNGRERSFGRLLG